MKVMRAAELLIEKVKKDYTDDIAVVVVMGSHLYNQTHAKSDLDMYFIPKTDRGFQLGTVFIIDGIGYDFWPISWDRIARIASHDERIGAIITEGKVIYYGSEDDLKKFNSYKEKAFDVQNQGHFIWKAHEKIKSSCIDYIELNRSMTLSDVRFNGIKLIYSVTEAISLLNRITIKRGRGKLLSEILVMPLVPQDFEANYLTLFESHDIDCIKKALFKMFDNTRQLIESTQTNHQKGSFKYEAHGFYEELINNYNKIERAYEIHDFQTALFAACEINIELHGILGNRGVDLSCLPDLMQAYDQDNLKLLLDASKKHQEELVALLISQGVSIRIIKDEIELKAYLDTL